MADDSSELPSLLVSLIQGSFFSIVLASGSETTPAWYAGNVYDMERATPQAVHLPSLSFTEPTTYNVFVSGDYEVIQPVTTHHLFYPDRYL
jgi:hypothetical protein